MKLETGGVRIEEFVELKPKVFSFLIDDNREHKKEKDVTGNVVENITHIEYNDVFLNNKCLTHSMNRI